jgi:hypothetical protein
VEKKMGFNSAVFLCNDAWGVIDDDPVGWWQKTKRELLACASTPVEYGFGNHVNGFYAVRNSHADFHQVVVTGGNYVTVLFNEYAGNRGHHEDEAKLHLVRQMADELGYRLVRRKK